MQFPTLDEYLPESKLVTAATEVPLPTFPAFDSHMHWGELLLGPDYAQTYDTGEAVRALKAKGVTGAVNLDGGWGDKLSRMLDKIGRYRDFVHTFGAVDLERFEEAGFESLAYRTIRDGKANGMRGLKFWKVLGLRIRDKAGRYLRPDDARLKPIWQTAAELNLPIVIHLADPVAFFEPLDKRNERYEELAAHPDWHFYGQGRYTFEQLMEYQERMIAENPKTVFIVAHVGSYAENLGRVSRWLDRYPNMYVDIAARISELGRQPYSGKRFLEDYADRVLFGTDFCPTGRQDYAVHYRFLETNDEYFPYSAEVPPEQGRWNIYGVALSNTALEKIYAGNARKLLGLDVDGGV